MVTLIKRNSKSDSIILIPTSQIKLCNDGCRYDYNDTALLSLADSIQRHGIINPLTVRKGDALFEVVSGRRRLRAAIILRLPEVPCIIVDANDVCDTELALIEDLQKQSLNMFEQARLIYDFIEQYSLTQEDAAKRLSCSQSSIANKLRLLKFTDEEKKSILSASLSERHARALLRIADVSKRTEVLRRVIADDMNVASCESLVERTVGENANLVASMLRSRACTVKDPAFFFNTVEQTVRRMKSVGMNVTTESSEADDYIEVRVRLLKR